MRCHAMRCDTGSSTNCGNSERGPTPQTETHRMQHPAFCLHESADSIDVTLHRLESVEAVTAPLLALQNLAQGTSDLSHTC